ncbi:Gag-Pol polyprotein, partial [Mucuna pruriens]
MTISRRQEMPQQPILFGEVFYVWGNDFMGPFLVSNGYSHILLIVDYVSRWAEAIATKTNDAKVVVDFLKSNIFYWFGVLKALITNQGSHFCNKAMSSLLYKYRVVHRVATAYHPQTNGQAEDWSQLLEDALWAHRTMYRTPLGMSLYQIIFGKLHSKWDGLFVITNVFPYGVVELKDENTNNTFQVNEHQIKPFHEGPMSTVGEMESISLIESAPLDNTPLASLRITSVFMSCIEGNASFNRVRADSGSILAGSRPTVSLSIEEVQNQDLGSWKLSKVIARYSWCNLVDGNLSALPSLVHHSRPSIGDHRERRTLWRTLNSHLCNTHHFDNRGSTTYRGMNGNAAVDN